MRIWDINPGYLNRGSLLGEHRELHGMVAIFKHGHAGYSQHPETLRWRNYRWALKQRHQLLVAEMQLRGYQHNSPVDLRAGKDCWPETYIDTPSAQFEILREKYIGKQAGRIALPQNAQQLWSQHKYSVMARNNARYQHIGKQIAGVSVKASYAELANELCEILRQRPTPGGIQNALLHMWGYVADAYPGDKHTIENWPLKKLCRSVQALSIKNKTAYLLASTALSELAAWL